MYSLKTNSWKKVESRLPHKYDIFLPYGTSLNGAIHWVCKDYERKRYVIVAFSLVDEKFSKIAVPVQEPINSLDLGVFRGCLCMSSLQKGEFWVMKEYGVTRSWTNVANETPKSLVLMKNDELKNDELLFLTDSKKFVLYNMRERTSKDLILPDAATVGKFYKLILQQESGKKYRVRGLISLRYKDLAMITLFDYRVLNGSDKDDFQMYSLKTNSWKKVESWFPHNNDIFRPYGASLNGAIHWVCDEYERKRYVIVAFSLVDEKFSKIVVPI
ncbi:F-box/kelch-repeat protein At3g06240-like [Cornus florida]|uniref:F-box/kelch-repeat protein At3g06240-like n=1 Tax=Cornus florida TaxID=4283 RepID=UPI0028A0F304|nr:F-box/kelch-repeat protein At3g06240-like [Cornus florida]